MCCTRNMTLFGLVAVGLFGLAAFVLLAGGGPAATGTGEEGTQTQVKARSCCGAAGQAPAAGCKMAGTDRPAGGACKMCAAKGAHGKTHAARVAHLAEVKGAIETAKSAVASGDTKAALAALEKAHKIVTTLLGEMTATAAGGPATAMAKPGFANTHCPMMGSKIDPAKVPENLVREYRGRKVAFCCGGCPGAWDTLTDAERDAKLGAVRAGK